MRYIILPLLALVAGCSHPAPMDVQAYQSVLNPICIVQCRAENAAQLAKGSSNVQGAGTPQN